MARLRTVTVLLAGALAVLLGPAQGCGKSPKPDCGVRCGGVCADQLDYQTDPANCGGCGVACGSGGSCGSGVCQCPSGATRCDGLVPRCRDLQTDAGACGTCGTRCEAALKPGATCQAGACGCWAPTVDCGALCTNTQTDAANCGAGTAGCDHACLAYATCAAGACACPASRITECVAQGTCADLTTDPKNCGTCGNVCPLQNEACITTSQATACACPPALPDTCGAAGSLPARCTNRSTSTQDCGACGNACTATGQTCSSGTCACPTGQDVCGGACSAKPTGSVCSATTHAWECPSGPTPGCAGQCCGGGTACCQSGACPTTHSNGLGQSYFDCNPPYAPAQTTAQAALAAANAWSAGTTYDGTTSCGTGCLGRQTATQCAVWCYAPSSWAGLVSLNAANNVCLCPIPGSSPGWN